MPPLDWNSEQQARHLWHKISHLQWTPVKWFLIFQTRHWAEAAAQYYQEQLAETERELAFWQIIHDVYGPEYEDED